MQVQYVLDNKGRKNAVMISLREWNALKKKYAIQEDNILISALLE
jgi:PHD/YefM family antitoxin component YafN of YafNO toxin-antitoxin module